MAGPAVFERTAGPTLPVRALWYFFVGWWFDGLDDGDRASAIWMAVGWLLCVTVIGLPFGLMMINRVSFVFSLHRGYA